MDSAMDNAKELDASAAKTMDGVIPGAIQIDIE
jgi:hypothetical protein